MSESLCVTYKYLESQTVGQFNQVRIHPLTEILSEGKRWWVKVTIGHDGAGEEDSRKKSGVPKRKPNVTK